MKKEIGAELTKAVKKRYNQIVAFTSFSALQQSGIGKMESLEGDRKGSYLLRVSANYRLIVKPKTKDLRQNKWVEIICWESMEAAQAALEKLPQISEFQKYCSTLIDEGTMMFHLEEMA